MADFDNTIVGLEFESIGFAEVRTQVFGVAPTEGNSQILLTTRVPSVSDTELESFLELDTGELDSLNNGDATEGSAIQLAPIEVEAGQLVAFDFNFLTNEGTPSSFNDFAFVSIEETSELADTNSTFVLSPASNFGEETGYQTFFFESDIDTTLTVGIGIVDVEDSAVDSGLLIDNFRVITPVEGTAGDDILDGTIEDDFISGLAGNDTIRGFAGNDFLEGGTGNDSLLGGADNDFLEGGTGNDNLLGGAGDDNLSGDEGNDVLQGESGDDLLNGGEGNDTIGGADGADFLLGGDGEDLLSGGDGSDSIEGNLSDDLIAGGRGRDNLNGQQGNDTIRGDGGNDSLRGGNGSDILRGNGGNDVLRGNNGSDFLGGGFGNDLLLGGNGKDNLNGSIGSDTLNGGFGDDTLRGGLGNDFLTGGAGADSFVLAAGQSGETITDFEDDIDKFILDGDLSFSELDILSTGNETVIVNNNTILAVVEVTPAFIISVEDFVFDA